MMEHQGIRWGYVFLRAPNFLSGEDRDSLMTTAVEMYLSRRTGAGYPRRRIRGPRLHRTAFRDAGRVRWSAI